MARPRRPHMVWIPRRTELKVQLARANLRVTELARDLGRSRCHVSDIVNGKRTSEVMAHEIARYFGVPVEDLFELKDLENPDQASAA